MAFLIAKADFEHQISFCSCSSVSYIGVSSSSALHACTMHTTTKTMAHIDQMTMMAWLNAHVCTVDSTVVQTIFLQNKIKVGSYVSFIPRYYYKLTGDSEDCLVTLFGCDANTWTQQ
jgi:hypothetical protein